MDTMQKTSASYLEEMLSFETKEEKQEPSEIAQFYTGCNILITGGSGFLGKVLIEKLLRSVPDIGTLYILMRPKKGVTPEKRLQKIFDDVLYDEVKKKHPNFLSKVKMVEGDMGEKGLGLSEESRKLLLNTDVIFHGAATVRFDVTLRVISNINIRGTKELLLFAKEMPNIKAFVYISTAFCHCVRKFIDEKFYKPSIDPCDLMRLVEILDDKQLELLTPSLIGKYPNTYTYSKTLAEDVVRIFSAGIPTCIVRPSIVASMASEPLVAWTDSFNGATAVVLGAGMGILRTIHCHADKRAEIIPVDYSIAMILAAGWDVAVNGKIQSKIADTDAEIEISDEERIPIYNNVAGNREPFSWSEFMEATAIGGVDVPSQQVFWCYTLYLHKYWWMHYVSRIFLHTLPAVFVDAYLWATGQKPQLLKIYKKAHKLTGVLSYFTTQQWRFGQNNVMKLQAKLNSTDRWLFNFDFDTLDWELYQHYFIRGLRVYGVKEPMDTIPAGRKRHLRLRLAHNSIVTITWLLFAWIVVKFLLYLWSFCPLASQ